MTGFRDDELTTLLKDSYQVKNSSSVSKTTFVLLVKSHDDDSSKIKKAKELKIPVMTKDEFVSAFLK